jgi:hypothetical protein
VINKATAKSLVDDTRESMTLSNHGSTEKIRSLVSLKLDEGNPFLLKALMVQFLYRNQNENNLQTSKLIVSGKQFS